MMFNKFYSTQDGIRVFDNELHIERSFSLPAKGEKGKSGKSGSTHFARNGRYFFNQLVAADCGFSVSILVTSAGVINMRYDTFATLTCITLPSLEKHSRTIW